MDPELIEVQDDLTNKEHLICILEEAEHRTSQKVTKFLKVQWSNHTKDEATWNAKITSGLNTLTSSLLPLNSRDENFV